MTDHLLLKSLQNFYEDTHYSRELIKVLQGSTKVSLRSIDWFITNYSKSKNTHYPLYSNKDYPTLTETCDTTFTKVVNVHQSYKSQLKSYSKKTFDPFCRRQRIEFQLDNDVIETTVGQLNFFRWALQHKIIEYIHIHQSEIEDNMNTCLLKIKISSSKKTGVRKKREELSLSATRGLSKTNIGVQLVFD